jgi:hypothetical protein
MIKNFAILLLTVTLFACNDDTLREEAYHNGYEAGHKDGYGWSDHGISYNDENSYQTSKEQCAYKEFYSIGYDAGYKAGENDLISQGIDLYVLIDADREEEAKYISRIYRICEETEYEAYGDYCYDEYIYEEGKYYAKSSVESGEYKIKLGEKITDRLFKVEGCELYIQFKEVPDLTRGKEGIVKLGGSDEDYFVYDKSK